ncbi:MAG: hypothetical protein GC181_12885 [Bacteroidetes bacterium]|nr:hypothetical protein [Bacteroidota bacterium]
MEAKIGKLKSPETQDNDLFKQFYGVIILNIHYPELRSIKTPGTETGYIFRQAGSIWIANFADRK